MKKLTCLLLVLAMAPMASAVLSLQLQGGGSTMPNDGTAVTVELVSSVAVANSFGVNIQSGIADPISGSAPALNAGFDSVKVNGTVVNTVSGARKILIDRTNGVIAAGSPVIAAGVALYSFQIAAVPATLAGTVVNLADAVGSPIVSPGPPYGPATADGASNALALAITIIPEPMTIALLGLGGLFLRRRK